MDDKQRLQLQNMVKANNVEDQTALIRDLKHSKILRGEIDTLLKIKAQYSGDDSKINEQSISDCAFLFTYYTDIYNKVKKDEIDINLLYKFLDVLKQIEDGDLDQHEGSFRVGTILKEIYIDSALKKSEKLDKLHESKEEPKPKQAEVKISWKQYKILTTI